MVPFTLPVPIIPAVTKTPACPLVFVGDIGPGDSRRGLGGDGGLDTAPTHGKS